ncbi:MAG: asparagine synthase (glutamine-hydrolyzing) [Vicinamibacteria bacterium]
MCGIAAMFSGDAISPHALAEATRALRHRGPDGEGTWVAPSGRVGLGHARLSIIDLTTGAQPLSDEERQTHVVVNGEFYGYECLQQELERSGHRLRTRSDSEVVLHLYEDMGTRCLERLRGEFAFVLWDGRNQTLVAARDRFGIKPLYYAWHRGTLCLASEIKGLLAMGVPAVWDRESLFQYAFVSIDDDRTVFDGIHQVPPGHYLLATRTGHRLIRYWDFDYPEAAETSAPLDEEYWVQQVREVLRDAVRVRLRADVPVGVYLSGGVDSSTILGMAAELSSAPLDAFTVSFCGDAFDEIPLASEMAAKVDARCHSVRVDEPMLADNFSDAIWHFETLLVNLNGVAKYLLSALVRANGYKVVLTGEGADEVFAGYSHLVRDAALSRPDGAGDLGGVISPEVNEAMGGLYLPIGESLPTGGLKRTLGHVPSWLEARSGAGLRLRSLFAEGFRQEFAERDPFRVFLNRFDVSGQLTGRDPLHQAMYLWSKAHFHATILSVCGDRSEMAHSVEGRHPLLDHHLVELAREIPATMKVRGGVGKHVLREAARPYITDAIYRRPKQPFTAPPLLTGKGARLREMAQDVLRSDALDDLPFFDRKSVLALLDSLLDGTAGTDAGALWGAPLVTVLSACALQQRFRPGAG